VFKTGLNKENDHLVTTDILHEIVSKYTGASELALRIAKELINHIDVYHAQRSMD